MKPTIVVLAEACRTSGALTIYKQFVSWLPIYASEARWYIFVDPTMPQPVMDNVTYIRIDNHSWQNRIKMMWTGMKQHFEAYSITPDCIFSLQNAGIKTSSRQIVYYHQSLPLYEKQWNPLKKEERAFWLYKHIYPWFVSSTINRNTEFVAQIPFIKRGIARKYGMRTNKVHVAFPDMADIDTAAVKAHTYESDTYNFLYPATNLEYKNHRVIIDAMSQLMRNEPSIAWKIKIHFTFSQSVGEAWEEEVSRRGLGDNFVFHPSMPYSELLGYYKSCDGLLFPSTVETIGMPLLEAAAFGLPIIAADLDYAHEVLANYTGAAFEKPNAPDAWEMAMLRLCGEKKKFPPIKRTESDWPKVFGLILKNNE